MSFWVGRREQWTQSRPFGGLGLPALTGQTLWAMHKFSAPTRIAVIVYMCVHVCVDGEAM